MRKFLFSIVCATVGFLLALVPSTQAQSSSDKDALKKAREAEEEAKKEAVKRAKEAEKAAKKAREQEEAARKAERAEAEKKARARDEALRRARAAAEAARSSEGSVAPRKIAEAEVAANKARIAEEEARKASETEAQKRVQAVEEARKAAEAAKEAAAKAEAREAARKAREAEESARHEATIRKAQEKEAAKRARENAEELRKLNAKQEAERKAKEAELARKAKAEQELAKKSKAEQASRQAQAAKEAAKAKSAQEAVDREVAREAARREKEAHELATRANSQAEAARKLQHASVSSSQPLAAPQNQVSYEGETFRIVKVSKDGSATIQTPSNPVPPSQPLNAAPAKSTSNDESQLRKQAADQAQREKDQEIARKARENEERARQETARAAAKASAERAAAQKAIAARPEPVRTSTRPLAPVGRASGATMVSPAEPQRVVDLTVVSPTETYTAQEKAAVEELRAKRHLSAETTPTYNNQLLPSNGKSRSRSNQARYYEELWEKELAARAAKQKSQPHTIVKVTADDRRAQARYYEELWRKEQEAKAARSAHNATINQGRSYETKPSVSRSESVAPRTATVVSTTTEATRLTAAVQAAPKNGQTESLSKVKLATESTSAEKEALRRAEEETRQSRAQAEAARKAAQDEVNRKAASEKEALKQAEEDARRARAEEEAARKNLEAAAAKKAREEREAAKRAEEEAARKARAEENARRAAEREATQRARETRTATTSPQIQAETQERKGFWSRFRSDDKASQPAPDVSALLSEEERRAQDQALEALRQKQAELDAQDAQLRTGGTVIPATRPAQPAVSPSISALPAKPTAPSLSAEEAAKDARALAATKAELQTLEKKLAAVSAEVNKVRSDIETAQKELSSTPATGATRKFEVIVDNNDARLVGTWAEGKTGGFYGKDYNFKGKGTGANYADFAPNLPTAGTYELFEWHVAGANRAADAPYIINYDGGSQVVTVNQQLNGGKWNSIGTFQFAAGQSGSVRVTDGIGLQGQMVMADAIKFVLTSGGGTTQTVDTSARERAIEALRIKQDALSAEEARLKSQVQAAERRIATIQKSTAERAASLPAVSAPPQEADVQVRAQQALQQKEAELNQSATQAPQKANGKKLISVKNAPEAVPAAAPARPLTAKEQKLADLLQRYKADEITPREYHQQRARILAEQ